MECPKPLITLFVLITLLIPVMSHSSENPCELILDLETAISYAINNNRQLLNQHDNALKAHYQVKVAASEFDLHIKPKAELGYVGGGSVGSGPAVGTGIGFSKLLACGTRICITPSVLKAHNNFKTDVATVITQPLFRNFGTENTYSHLRGAQFGLRSAQRNFYISQCQIVYRTIYSLYELIKAIRNAELNEKSYMRVQKFFQAATLKAKIGVSDPLDVYRAEIEMRHAEDTFKAALEKREECEDTLRDLLALPANTSIKVEIPLYHGLNEIEINEAIETALSNRIELDQAQDQLMENTRLSKIAKKKLLPDLNLVVNYSNQGENEVFTESWRKRESRWGVGFTTNTDINPKADQYFYEQSLLAIESGKRNIDQTIATITFEIKRAMRHLERTRQRIETQAKQIKTSEDELRLSQLKFDCGKANNFDLIQAEKTYRMAQLCHWNALVDHIVGEYQLKAALGTLMEKPPL